MKKIVELLIDWNNLEMDELGVDIMSLVDKPAIQTSWLAFADECEDCFDLDEACWPGYEAIGTKTKNGREVPNCVPIEAQEFKSYNDYPEAAKNNAQRALDWAEENGWGSCGTGVGKQRANQLAKGENISEDTIARMASFARHEQHKDVPYSEGCGGLMWDAWGGSAGINWAKSKLQKVREEKLLEVAQEFGEVIDLENAVFIDITKDKFSSIGDFLKGVVGLDILGRRGVEQGEGVTKYRYVGPPAERNFCKSMLRLNKFYTLEEIEQMSGRIDTGFRHNNQSYSIFEFKGGVNCKHYWEEVELFKEGRETVVIQKGRADGNAGRTASAANNYWRFSEADEKIITGPAMIPNQLILRKDDLGNQFHVYFSEDTIKKINEKFMIKSAHNTDINHDDKITTQNTLLESWIVEDPQYDKSTKLGFDVPKGTWMVSYRINDDKTWNKIKNGELNGFSVTGNFVEKIQK